MVLFLALDQGTTSSRALVFDQTGAVRGWSQRPLRQSFPEPGLVEHDALEIWRDQLACARDALADARLTAADIMAIGITNQRETTVLWDRATGQPIHPAIVWQDRRSADWCDRQRAAGLADRVRAITGLVLDPYFSASKIAWLLDHVPGARTRAENGELAFGTIDSWLIWNLTGGKVHATDVTNASRTLLFDIGTGQWSTELLAAFAIPAALLPEVRPSASQFGSTVPDLLGGGVAIRGVAGDQQAALFGQGCNRAGAVKNTYGTGCFMLMHTGGVRRESRHGLLTTLAAQTGSELEYALEGSVFTGGAAVQWLRDGLGLIKQAEDIEALADSVPDAGGVTFVPAFTGLGSPYWDPDARGMLIGLTRGTGPGHIARATLDAIALQSAELLAAMEDDGNIKVHELQADGGASGNDFLMQIQCDLLGVPIHVARLLETTALGAAGLAAVASGIAPAATQPGAIGGLTYRPQEGRDWAESQLRAWRRAVERCRGWARADGVK